MTRVGTLMFERRLDRAMLQRLGKMRGTQSMASRGRRSRHRGRLGREPQRPSLRITALAQSSPNGTLAKSSGKGGRAGTGSGSTTAHTQSHAVTVAAATNGIQSCFHLIHSIRRALASLADAICHQP